MMNHKVLFFLQVTFIANNIRYLVAAPQRNVVCPLPKAGRSGDMPFTKIVVKEFHRGMSNMYTYGVKLKDESTHTLYNNGTIYVLRDGAKAIFNGREVCISTKKVSILDQDGSNERRLQQCEHKCFAMNETLVQVTRIEEGADLLNMKIRGICCVWSSKTWLEISVQKPSYKCLKCSGKECQKNSTALTQCTPGLGCFSMVFTMRLKNKTTVYPMKGCTNHQVLRGRGCWNGCRKMAVNYNMCIECCFGDGCNVNKTENSTEIPTKPPLKMWRVGGGSKGNFHSETSGLLLLLLLLLCLLGVS